MPQQIDRVATATFKVTNGKIRDNKERIEKERNVDFEHVKSLLERGRMSLENGRYDTAIDYAKDVLRIVPKNAQAYRLMGEAYDAQRDCVNAIDAFLKATKYEENEASHYYKLGQMFAGCGALSEADKIYAHMERMFPNDKWTRQLEMAISLARRRR